MRATSRFVIALILSFSFTSASFSQDRKEADSQRPELIITASASKERVRFAAPSSVVQIRLEVYDSSGKKLFDNELRGGNVIDWHLQDGQAERLPVGDYLCVVTVKSLSGKLSQKLASLIVEAATARLQPAAGPQLTAQQTQAVGPVEDDSTLTIVQEGEPQTATVIAHNGEEGQITRGKGALSFRLGDFFTGKDTEQMRLTEQGYLGIGVTNPQVRLDVDGLIRASQGIVFPDGSVQFSAARKTLGARSRMGDEGGGLGQEHFTPNAVDISGTGTTNRVTKWIDGPAGVVGDSQITEVGGNVGIGTAVAGFPFPGGAFDVVQSSPGSDLLMRVWNSVTNAPNANAGAKLRYVAATNATSQLQLTDWSEFLSSIAGNNQIGLQFRVRAPGDPNSEAGLAAAARMSILRNGNVGIGITNPGALLDARRDGIILGLGSWQNAQLRIGGSTDSRMQLNIGYDTTNNLGVIQAGHANFEFKSLLINPFGGNVGIGTTNPAGLLTLRGATPVRILGDTTTLSGVEYVDFMAYNSFFNSDLGGMRIQRQTTGNIDTMIFAAQSGSAASEKLRVTGNGNVGIGTPFPSAKLHVLGETVGLYAEGGALGVRGVTTDGYGVRGDSINGFGVAGNSTSSDGVHGVGFRGVAGYTTSGIGVYGDNGNSDTNGHAGYFNGRVTITGKLDAKNLPTIKFNQADCPPPNECITPIPRTVAFTVDTITIDVPAPGFVFVTAFASINCGDPPADGNWVEFNLFKCTDSTCAGGDYLARTKNAVFESTLHISWVIPVNAPGPLTLRTNGINNNVFNVGISVGTHNLTAVYIPK